MFRAIKNFLGFRKNQWTPQNQLQYESDNFEAYVRAGGKHELPYIRAYAAVEGWPVVAMLHRMIDQIECKDSPCYEGVELIMPEPDDD